MLRSIRFLAAVALLCPAAAALAADPEPASETLLGKAGDFSLAPPEVSESAANGWYLRADAGYVAGYVDGTLHNLISGGAVGNSSRSSGWSVGAGLGYRFTPWLRGEVSLDYLDLGGADTVLGRFDANATVALASVYWDVISIAGFTPYLSGGVGFAIDRISPPALMPAIDDQWKLAWSLGAGVSYAFSEAWSVDLGYRYVNVGAPDLSIPGVTIDALGGHQLRLGLRYSFGE